jgi:hypothetical protein
MRQRGIVVEKRSKSYPVTDVSGCENPLTQQPVRWTQHVGADVQASPDAVPAILSVKSVLSVVKNAIAFCR